jgi:hypothetical protein
MIRGGRRNDLAVIVVEASVPFAVGRRGERNGARIFNQRHFLLPDELVGRQFEKHFETEQQLRGRKLCHLPLAHVRTKQHRPDLAAVGPVLNGFVEAKPEEAVFKVYDICLARSSKLSMIGSVALSHPSGQLFLIRRLVAWIHFFFCLLLFCFFYPARFSFLLLF